MARRWCACPTPAGARPPGRPGQGMAAGTREPSISTYGVGAPQPPSPRPLPAALALLSQTADQGNERGDLRGVRRAVEAVGHRQTVCQGSSQDGQLLDESLVVVAAVRREYRSQRVHPGRVGIVADATNDPLHRLGVLLRADADGDQETK